MLLVTFFAFFVVLLSMLTSLRIVKHGLEIAFIFVFLFSAIRYDFGADYMNYYTAYQDFVRYNDFGNFLTDHRSQQEPGWAILCLLSRPIGFFGLVAIISLFVSLIYYKFIKTYIPLRWQWIVVYFYMIDPYCFLIQLSTIRQTLSTAIFICALSLFYDKKFIMSVLVVILAFSIHRSAFVLFPLIFIGFIPQNNGKQLSILALAAFFVLYFSVDVIFNWLLPFMMSNDTLSDYIQIYMQETSPNTFGIGALLANIPFIILLLYVRRSKIWRSSDRHIWKLITLLALFYYLISPLSLLTGIIGRLSSYFLIFALASIPATYSMIKMALIRKSLLALHMLIILYQYILLFDDPDWVTFNNYKTIFY